MALLVPLFSLPAVARRVIFLGNSFTYGPRSANFPSTLKMIAEANGDSLVYEMYAANGLSVCDHAQMQLDERNFSENFYDVDVLVLQPYSQELTYGNDVMAAGTWPCADALHAAAQHLGVQLMLTLVWAYPLWGNGWHASDGLFGRQIEGCLLYTSPSPRDS